MKLYSLNEQSFPIVVTPEAGHFNAIGWAVESRDFVRRLLNQHGAVLFRGFKLERESQFEAFIAAATTDEWVEYREAATPRSHVGGNVFTSTEYPANESIFFHNENSHTTSWPLYLAFFCKTPAPEGGETPIADCRKIYADIPLDTRRVFEEKKVLYSRNFGYGLGIPWRKGFPVTSREEMDAYCRQYEMTPEWKGGDKLGLKYVRRASLPHPVTGDKVWFNHATFFNFNTLAPATRELIRRHIGEENAPYNTFYGDGGKIDEETIALLKRRYQKHSVKIPYQRGDVLLIDNMLTAHGREPFKGKREVLVAMTRKIESAWF